MALLAVNHDPDACPHCQAHGLTRDDWANAYTHR